MKNKKKDYRKFSSYIMLIVAIAVIFVLYNLGSIKYNDLSYDELLKDFNEKKVTEIKTSNHTGDQTIIIIGKLDGYQDNEYFKVIAPYGQTTSEELQKYYGENNFKWEVEKNSENSNWIVLLVNVVPIVVVLGGCMLLFSRLNKTNSNSMDFGRSRARLSEDGGKVRFKDVAGLKEEKEEVAEIIDFLKNPKKFQKMGARIPKGVLLEGPPGTGKTLLARAVAGEANVPFYYISGSDFVELFVGVGASRVRDMFKQAKASAPCLIFIDEIDAVGRQRGTGLGGGHDEREQTLNQLLTEMDGFGVNEGIIVMAATNRPDVLDPALLRPGRFDRQVTVGLPDPTERLDILKVHAKGKVLASNVSLENLSHRTPGFSGADLENLLNEAALLAVRRDKEKITMAEIDEATDRVLMGPAKVSRKYNDKEKRLVAIHESGHAVVGLKLEDAEDVHKITIIPRGYAGGYTMMMPKEEHMAVQTKNELLARITGLLGGRVAEELFLGEMTTGASDDFSKATKIARAMVTQYGMSDLGPLTLEEKNEGIFLGRDYNKARDFSDAVALEIDKEVQKIIEECYKETKKILKENEKLVMAITEALIERETITKEEIEELVETGKITDRSKDSDSELDELKEKAKEAGIKGYTKMTEEELKEALKENEKEEKDEK